MFLDESNETLSNLEPTSSVLTNETIDNSKNNQLISTMASNNANIGINKYTIDLQISRLVISHTKCFICNKDTKRNHFKKNIKLHLISQETIRDVFKKTRILIPYGSRASMNHLNGNTIDNDSISQLEPYKKALL